MLEPSPTLFSDTIVALCTPQGNGALALIRVSGPQSWEICAKITRLKSGKLFSEIPTHSIHAADIFNNGEAVDAVMILALRGPRTFTGYDTIEITAHNNPLIIQALIELIIAHGARPAQQGEFTRQAYDNKKIDLLQAEAINELITAQTQTALKKSLSQLQGSLSTLMQEIEDKLCKAIAWCESSFEFLDDEGDFHTEIYQFLREITDQIDPILAGYGAQKQIRQGYRVTLIGGVNAGKSSLFNLLIGHKRAIVTPLAGTTRDSIESTQIIGGTTTTFIDTAGLRTTADIIEQEGIERSYAEAHASDVILLVIDGSSALTTQEEAIYSDLIEKYPKKIIFVQNKSDIISRIHPFFDTLLASVHASAHTGVYPEQCRREVLSGHQKPLTVSTQDVTCKQLLEAEIIKKLSSLATHSELPFLVNKRHFELLQSVHFDINQVKSMLESSQGLPHYELISYHLKHALERISEVTGKSVSENALDRVFKEFCVGK